MDVAAAAPIHSIRPAFHDPRSPLNDAKSLLAGILGAESDASDVAASAASSSPENLIEDPAACIRPSSSEAVSDVKDQRGGSPPDDAKTNSPMTSSQVSDHVSHGTFTGSHQQQPALEGPTNATGFQKSSSNHNNYTQSSGYGSQSHNVNVLPQHLHHRGDGPSSQHSYSGRREQNRRNRDWNVHRTFNNGRNTHMPPRGVPRFTMPLPPPPHTSPPPYPLSQYIPPFAPPPYGGTYTRPAGFGPNFPYYAAPPPGPPGLVPYMPPIPTYGNVRESPILPHFPTPDPELCVKIVRQIEYYFSFDNLIKDMYLRKQMDEQGWVPVRLIASFRKIKELTDNIQIILDALHTSNVLEILGDKIRRRDDWQRWIIPRSYQLLDDVQSSGIFHEPSQN